ncbi:MAG: RNB domain-containing ribonuclease, partial [Mycobacterium sp.]
LDRRTAAAGSCVRLPYADVPKVANDPRHRLNAAVRATHELASALRAQRAAAGSLAFYDLTRGYASTEDGTIAQIPLGQRTIGYVMVAELMIAAGAAVADWCVDHDLPILFRNHRTSLLTADGADLATDIAASLHDPELFEQLRQRVNRSYGRAVYDVVPRGHHGLRVPSYAHVTSPLRRYPDLVCQQIVWAHLAGEQVPYNRAQVAAIAEYVNAVIAERQERRHAYFQEQRRQEAQQHITARSYADLDTGQWRQVFDAMTKGDPVDGIEAELLRRLEAQILLPNDVARIAAAGDEWIPLWQKVFAAVRARNPEFGPSAFSGRAQIIGQDPTAATVETLADLSPQTGPRFAARVLFAGHTGSWQVASTKKAAAAQAMWELLDVLCGHRDSVDGPFSWAERADAAAPAAADVAPVDVSGLQDTMTRYLAGIGPGQRDRAVNNPVAWLTNTAAQLRIGQLHVDYRVSGPSHAPIFECTVTMAGLSHAATAASKSQARVAAASGLLAAMLQAVPHGHPGVPAAARPAPDTAPPVPAATITGEVQELPVGAWEHLAGMTAAQQVKASKNPVAWVTNFAVTWMLGTVDYQYDSTGPSHAHEFTCTASIAGIHARGSGATKAQARTAAVDGVLSALVAAGNHDGEESRL